MEKTIVVAILGSISAVIISIISGIISYNTAKTQRQSNDTKLILEFLNFKLKVLEEAQLKFNTAFSGENETINGDKKNFKDLAASYLNKEIRETNNLVQLIGKYLGTARYKELKDLGDLIGISMAKLSGEVNFGLKMDKSIETIPIDLLLREIKKYRKMAESYLDFEIINTIKKIENSVNKN